MNRWIKILIASVLTIGLIYFILNRQDLLKFGFAKTSQTEAIVIDTEYSSLIDKDWSARYWYQYSVKGISYFDTAYIYEDAIPLPRTEVKVEYALQDPSINLVLK